MGVLLDRTSLLATHQALRAIAIFAVGRSDHHNVSGVLVVGSVVALGERHDSLLLRGTQPQIHCSLTAIASVIGVTGFDGTRAAGSGRWLPDKARLYLTRINVAVALASLGADVRFGSKADIQ